MDSDDNPALLAKYSVTAPPTILTFTKDGVEVGRHQGAVDAATLTSLLAAAAATAE